MRADFSHPVPSPSITFSLLSPLARTELPTPRYSRDSTQAPVAQIRRASSGARSTQLAPAATRWGDLSMRSPAEQQAAAIRRSGKADLGERPVQASARVLA